MHDVTLWGEKGEQRVTILLYILSVNMCFHTLLWLLKVCLVF